MATTKTGDATAGGASAARPGTRGAAGSATAAAPKRPAAVGLRQLAAGLAAAHAMPRRQVEAVLSGLVSALAEHLKSGAKIRVNGLGTLQVRERPARTGRNPATGEPIEIRASRKVAFRPAKELKAAV
jgi:DNA-binding protein HU-beta